MSDEVVRVAQSRTFQEALKAPLMRPDVADHRRANADASAEAAHRKHVAELVRGSAPRL